MSARYVWHEFASFHGKLPPQKRYVLVATAEGEPEPVDLGVEFKGGVGLVSRAAPGVAVGYLKFAAGDRECPYFVIPGGRAGFRVTHWCDCLGDDFAAPCWPGTQRDAMPNHRKDPR